jgi:hypothetical protein
MPPGRTKTITEVSSVVTEQLCKQLRSNLLSLNVLERWPMVESERILLESVARAAIACYAEDETWFDRQDPKTLASQLVPLLIGAVFRELGPSGQASLKQLFARPRIGGKNDKGEDGLVAYVAEAIAARQNAAAWLPKRRPSNTSRIIQQMRDALEAGESFRPLMVRMALTHVQIAMRMNVHKSMVTRIVRHGGKGVSEENIESFFKIVANNLKPG